MSGKLHNRDATTRAQLHAAAASALESAEERRDGLADAAASKLAGVSSTAENLVETVEVKSEEAAARVSGVVDGVLPGKKKVPILLRVYGALCVVFGAVNIPTMVFSVSSLVYSIINYGSDEAKSADASVQALVLNCVNVAISIVLAAMFVVLGVRLLRSRRKRAALIADSMVGVAVLCAVLSLMTSGMGANFILNIVNTVFLLALSVALDPTLREERALQRKLRAMEDRCDLEQGVLGRDKTGKGYLELNFFNLFWIFVVACVIGMVFESAVCPFVNGRIENRTGMLWGPFSPIYGVGATLMVIALNRFWNKNPLIVFAVSGVIGASFEFAASWFFQFAFGICAWDYSWEPFNIAGRTDLLHIVLWGCMGLLFIRCVVPWLLKLINHIPWNWRYGVTTAFALFMFINAGMTLLPFDCWYQRASGIEPDTPVAQFFAEHYDDEFMQGHFQTMSIDPSRSTR